MRTPLLVGIVVAAHVVAIGAVMMIQGCGTTSPGTYGGVPPDPPMPPTGETIDPAIPTTYQPPAPGPDTIRMSETTAYVVRKGEYLSGIARRFGLKVAEIMILNNLTDPDRIFEGQKLLLPGRVNLGTPAPPPRRAVTDGEGNYVVRSGDSLSAIAVRFKTTVKALKEANRLTSDRIRAGQKLVVPGATPVPPGAAPAADDDLGIPEPALDAEPVTDTTEAMPPAAAPDVAPVVAGGEYREHVVEEGEDLYSVSMMWGVSLASVKALNNLDGTTLTPGQALKIPTGD